MRQFNARELESLQRLQQSADWPHFMRWLEQSAADAVEAAIATSNPHQNGSAHALHELVRRLHRVKADIEALRKR